MDLIINEIYMANSDYANLEFYQVPGGKWKQIFYDFCWTFQKDHESLALRMSSTSRAAPYRTMFVGLLKYGPWKEAFFKRFAWTMENIYTADNVTGVIDKVAGSVASEIPAERAKFTDYVRDWDKEVEKMREFAKERPAIMLKYLKSVFNLTGSQLRSYFTFSDEEMKSGFNLSDESMKSIFG
jgi:hypothetical protein